MTTYLPYPAPASIPLTSVGPHYPLVLTAGPDPYESLLKFPDQGYWQPLQWDAQLLQEALVGTPSNSFLASQMVFGNELKQRQCNLRHQANLFYERLDLHQQHLREIDRRHLQVQERLFGVEINHFPDRDKQLRTLEGQLMQLEQQRRESELTFWHDTVELREQLFENAGEYRQARQRYRMLGNLEGQDGRPIRTD